MSMSMPHHHSLQGNQGLRNVGNSSMNNLGVRGPIELLDALRQEVEAMSRENINNRAIKEDYERKLEQQMTEMTALHKVINDLENRFAKIKQQHDEEVMRLRRQIEAMSQQSSAPQHGFSSFMPQQPPTQTMASLTGHLQNPQPQQQSQMSHSMTLPSLSMAIPGSNNQQNSSLAQNPPPTIPSLNQSNISLPPTINVQPLSQPSAFTPSQPQQPVPQKPAPKEVESSTTTDWLVGYIPGVKTSLTLALSHTLLHDSVVCSTAFSRDGSMFATGCNRSAQIYDVNTGKKTLICPVQGDDAVVAGVNPTFAQQPQQLYVRSVSFSPDNRMLATGAENTTVKLWDIANRKVCRTLLGHGMDIYSLCFSNDGNFLFSGADDKQVRVWDISQGVCLHTFGDQENGPKDGVTSVSVSPDGKLIAVGSLDKIVRVWDVNSHKLVHSLTGHLDSVYSVAFCPDGRSIASGALDKTVKIWDLNTAGVRGTLAEHQDFVLSVAYSPDGRWVVSGSKDRSVLFWDAATNTQHAMLQGHKNSVISVCMSGCGHYLGTGSGDLRSRIWKYSSAAPGTSASTSSSSSSSSSTTNSSGATTQPSTSEMKVEEKQE